MHRLVELERGVLVRPVGVEGEACADDESLTAVMEDRRSGREGEALRPSNLRTHADTLPMFSERIFWTEGRPVSGARR